MRDETQDPRSIESGAVEPDEYHASLIAVAYGPHCVQVFTDEDRQVNLFRAQRVLDEVTASLRARVADLTRERNVLAKNVEVLDRRVTQEREYRSGKELGRRELELRLHEACERVAELEALLREVDRSKSSHVDLASVCETWFERRDAALGHDSTIAVAPPPAPAPPPAISAAPSYARAMKESAPLQLPEHQADAWGSIVIPCPACGGDVTGHEYVVGRPTTWNMPCPHCGAKLTARISVGVEVVSEAAASTPPAPTPPPATES